VRFKDRQDAGRKLAEALADFQGGRSAVLALPRGGVPVACEIAKKLACPLDTILVRKLGMPDNPEYAFGALAEGDVSVFRSGMGGFISEGDKAGIIEEEKRELERRKEEYRSGSFLGKGPFDRIILVDDGLATGTTMEAALEAARKKYDPKEIIAAVPVAASDSAKRIRQKADRFITLLEDEAFLAVGEYYDAFDQTTDEEVLSILENSS